MTRSRWYLLVAALCGVLAVFLPWSWGSGSNFAMGLSLNVRWLGIAYLLANGLVVASVLLQWWLPIVRIFAQGIQVFLGFWMSVFSLSLVSVGLSFTGRSSLAFLGQTLTLGPGLYLLLVSSLACLVIPFLREGIDTSKGEGV